MDQDPLEIRYNLLSNHLDERTRRLWLGAEAISHGKGGISHVSHITGVTRNTISCGCKEIKENATNQEKSKSKRIRKEGGGRKALLDSDLSLLDDLEFLIEPTTRGDPENLLRWTTKSLRNLADELLEVGRQELPCSCHSGYRDQVNETGRMRHRYFYPFIVARRRKKVDQVYPVMRAGFLDLR